MNRRSLKTLKRARNIIVAVGIIGESITVWFLMLIAAFLTH